MIVVSILLLSSVSNPDCYNDKANDETENFKDEGFNCAMHNKHFRRFLLSALKMIPNMDYSPDFEGHRAMESAEKEIITLTSRPSNEISPKLEILARKRINGTYASVEVRPTGDQFANNGFVISIDFENKDYSNISVVKDIHKKLNNRFYTMVLADARGREVEYDLSFGVSHRGHNPRIQSSWKLKCFK